MPQIVGGSGLLSPLPPSAQDERAKENADGDGVGRGFGDGGIIKHEAIADLHDREVADVRRVVEERRRIDRKLVGIEVRDAAAGRREDPLVALARHESRRRTGGVRGGERGHVDRELVSAGAVDRKRAADVQPVVAHALRAARVGGIIQFPHVAGAAGPGRGAGRQRARAVSRRDQAAAGDRHCADGAVAAERAAAVDGGGAGEGAVDDERAGVDGGRPGERGRAGERPGGGARFGEGLEALVFGVELREVERRIGRAAEHEGGVAAAADAPGDGGARAQLEDVRAAGEPDGVGARVAEGRAARAVEATGDGAAVHDREIAPGDAFAARALATELAGAVIDPRIAAGAPADDAGRAVDQGRPIAQRGADAPEARVGVRRATVAGDTAAAARRERAAVRDGEAGAGEGVGPGTGIAAIRVGDRADAVRAMASRDRAAVVEGGGGGKRDAGAATAAIAGESRDFTGAGGSAVASADDGLVVYRRPAGGDHRRAAVSAHARGARGTVGDIDAHASRHRAGVGKSRPRSEREPTAASAVGPAAPAIAPEAAGAAGDGAAVAGRAAGA